MFEEHPLQVWPMALCSVKVFLFLYCYFWSPLLDRGFQRGGSCLLCISSFFGLLNYNIAKKKSFFLFKKPSSTPFNIFKATHTKKLFLTKRKQASNGTVGIATCLFTYSMFI